MNSKKKKIVYPVILCTPKNIVVLYSSFYHLFDFRKFPLLATPVPTFIFLSFLLAFFLYSTQNSSHLSTYTKNTTHTNVRSTLGLLYISQLSKPYIPTLEISILSCTHLYVCMSPAFFSSSFAYVFRIYYKTWVTFSYNLIKIVEL